MLFQKLLDFARRVQAEAEEMNPYFQNWNYGYTLGPPRYENILLELETNLILFASEQTKGAYTTYEQQQGGGSGQIKQEPQQSWGQQQVKVGNALNLI